MSKIWQDCLILVEQQIEELMILMKDARYIEKQAYMQQLLAVRMAQEQELRILASQEQPLQG